MSIHKGHLRIIVLKNLEDNEISGYELCKKIEEETGWKPSYGSIYPLLNHLKEDKAVTIREEGKKKLYSLTKEGKEQLKELIKKKDEFIDKITEMIKSLDLVCGSKEAGHAIPFIEQMKKGKVIGFHPGMFKLKENIIKVMLLKDNKKNKKLREIIIETNKKVSKLL